MNDNNNVITLARLEALGACRSQRFKFTELFDDSVVVTRELAMEHAGAFDWYWAAEEMLTGAAFDLFKATYMTAIKGQEAAIEPFVKAYEAIRDEAWEEYGRTANTVDRSVREEIRRAKTMAANTEFEKAVEPFEAARQRATAAAFADAFLSSENQAVNACEHATAE